MCRPHSYCFRDFVPHKPCQNYVLRDYLCLCLWFFRLLCVYASPCVHLNPFAPSWVLSYPFFVFTRICVFLGNFPAMHARESYPANPNMSLFVVFACALVKVHPTAPIQTHIHPHIPVRHLDIHEIETYIILRKSITSNVIQILKFIYIRDNIRGSTSSMSFRT